MQIKISCSAFYF